MSNHQDAGKSQRSGKVVVPYRDFASLCPEPETRSNSSGSKQAKRNNNFPEKLHYVLHEMEKDGLQHVASWQPHGRSFLVHDVKRFETEILPFWFRQSKIASFQRQLNIYGFTRITAGADKGGYYHELFLRSKQFLAERIHRIKVKGMGPRKPVATEDLPDLYSFPFLPEENNGQANLVQQAEILLRQQTNAASGLPPVLSATTSAATSLATSPPQQHHFSLENLLHEPNLRGPGLPAQSNCLLQAQLPTQFALPNSSSSLALQRALLLAQQREQEIRRITAMARLGTYMMPSNNNNNNAFQDLPSKLQGRGV